MDEIVCNTSNSATINNKTHHSVTVQVTNDKSLTSENTPFLAGLSTVWDSAVGLGRLLNLDDRVSWCTSPDGSVYNTNCLNHYKQQ